MRKGDPAALLAGGAVLLAAACSAVVIVSLSRNSSEASSTRRTAQAQAIEETERSAASVNDLLETISNSVDDLARRLNDAELPDSLAAGLAGDAATIGRSCANAAGNMTDLEVALCTSAAVIPEVNGIGVVFAPEIDPSALYRPYANRIGGSLALRELATSGPGGAAWSDVDWFRQAQLDGPDWTNPRLGETSQKLLAIYSAPFFASDETLRGVIFASYTLDQLADDLQWLGVGKIGYPIILSQDGKLLSHPQSSRVADEFSGRARPDRAVSELQDVVKAGDSTPPIRTGFKDEMTDKPAWLIYQDIPSVGWTFGAVVVEEEVLGRTDSQTRNLINAGLGTLLAVLLVAAVAFGATAGNHRGLWVVSLLAGASALVGIGLIWYLTQSRPIEDDTAENSRDLADYARPEADDQPVFAGIFVQSVEFTGANDVTVSGIVWQEQRDDERNSNPPGFVFPEADSFELDMQYKRSEGNLTRVGWSFTASLRQTFDYSRYPLDRETVWLRLWPGDYERTDPLLPDLSSYQTLARSTRPGIENEKDFVVEGWTVEGSSFSIRENKYNVNFGAADLLGTPRPELYFNVHLKRSFLDALMSQLIPLAVVSVLLFGVLLVTTKDRIRSDRHGFSTLAVLAYCAALFFVVIVSHNELRSELQAQQIIYLEYFFFAAYLAILIVSANAILVGSGRGGRLIAARDNVIPSLLFWPGLNGALLVVTLFAFY